MHLLYIILLHCIIFEDSTSHPFKELPYISYWITECVYLRVPLDGLCEDGERPRVELLLLLGLQLLWGHLRLRLREGRRRHFDRCGVSEIERKRWVRTSFVRERDFRKCVWVSGGTPASPILLQRCPFGPLSAAWLARRSAELATQNVRRNRDENSSPKLKSHSSIHMVTSPGPLIKILISGG